MIDAWSDLYVPSLSARFHVRSVTLVIQARATVRLLRLVAVSEKTEALCLKMDLSPCPACSPTYCVNDPTGLSKGDESILRPANSQKAHVLVDSGLLQYLELLLLRAVEKLG